MISLDELALRYRELLPPRLNPLYEGFWTGAREHDIRLPLCSSCGRYHWYPLHLCPHCQKSDWRYSSVGLEATIFSYGVLRRPLHPGLLNRIGDIVALVVPKQAPEVRIATNILGTASAEVAIDALVRADFIDVTDDWTVPVYRVAYEMKLTSMSNLP